MALDFRLTALTFSGGQEVRLAANSITLVVGPNNSGKSSLLNEIDSVVRGGLDASQNMMRVLLSVDVVKTGSLNDLREFLQVMAKEFVDAHGNRFYRALNANVQDVSLDYFWTKSPGLGQISPFVCHLVDTQSRLNISSSPPSINMLVDPPSHPIHVLYENDEIEKRLSAFVEQSFGQEMIVNRGAGSTIPLHIGLRPKHTAESDRTSRAYLEKLAKTPMLSNQGDGIKSFVGSLLATLVAGRFVTLLDEPEAFLHPPQARQLGKILAKEHLKTQLLVATHSADILRGLLDGSAQNLSILRVTRRGNVNDVSILNAEDIKAFWADPILRFSNILDGLFHEGLILCEADTDCRLYSALNDKLSEEDTAQRWPDILYAASGGKDRMPVIVRALMKIRVPTKVVVDFDIFADESKLRLLFEALGGDWTDIKSDVSNLRNVIIQRSPPLKLNQVRDRVNEVFVSHGGVSTLTDQIREQIQAALKAASPWAAVKDLGLAALPPGDATQIGKRLLTTLKRRGLFVVPVGELEGFDRTEGNHGPKWLAKVMEKDLGSHPVLETARSFVRELVLSSQNNEDQI